MKPIKYAITTALLCFSLFINAFAISDPAPKVLTEAQGNSLIDSLNQLSQRHWYSDPLLAEKYAAEALQISEEFNYNKGKIAAFRNLGVSNDVMGNYDLALEWYARALSNSRKENDAGAEGALLNNIGLAHFNKGSMDQAMENYMLALPILEKTGPPARLASVLNNLGLILHNLNRQPEAISYHQEAYLIRKQENDLYGMGASLNNIGLCFESMEVNDSAMMYYRNSETIKRAINDRFGLATTLNNIGNLYKRDGSYKDAVNCFYETISLRNALNDKSGLASAHYNLSLVFQQTGQYEMSLAEAYKALDFALETGAQVREYKIYGGLMQTYREMGNFEKALEFYEKYFELKQSVFSLERSQQVADLQGKYETEKKEKEIADLNHENEVKTLQIEKQRSQTRFFIYSAFGILLLLGMAAMYFYNRIRYQHKLQIEKERIRQQQQGFRAVLEAGENERIRIARELHDGLGQILSTAKLHLYSLEEQLDFESKASLQDTLSIIDEAVGEVRTISHNMMPAVLMRLGLVPALHEMVRKINMAKKVEIDLELDDLSNHFSKDAEIAIYRIVQEILNNSLKHSNASRVDISLRRRNNNVLLSIGDNGIGMDTSQLEKSSGIGWLSINARVSLLNGSISINSVNGTGTVVNVKLVA